MSEQPPDAHPAPPHATGPTPSEATSTSPGWRDRTWSLPAVIAVALASVILGGLGGAALANVTDDGRHGRFGPGHEVQRDGQLRPPGTLNERQRERWRQWREQQRRQWRQHGLPSPSGPTPSP